MGSNKPMIGLQGAGKKSLPDVNLLLQQAIAHHDAGRHSEAAAVSREILTVQPGNAIALDLTGVDLYLRGELKLATTTLKRAIRNNNAIPDIHNHLGLALEAQGQLDAAVASLNKSLALKPDYAEARINLGNALNKLGRFPEAIASYREAIAIDPNDATSHFNLGIVLERAGRLEEAVASYRRALAIDPGETEALFNLGSCLQDTGRAEQLEQALECYARLLALEPDHFKAQLNLGAAQFSLHRLEEAVDSFIRAIALKPDDPEAHYDLGLTFMGLDRLEEAEASFERAIAIDPDHTSAHNNLGLTLARSGDLDGASSHYLRALEIEPDSVEANANLSTVYLTQGRVDEGLAHLNRAVASQPDRAEAHWNLSLPLLATGNLERGWEEYDWRWNGHENWFPTPPKNRGFPQAWWAGEDLEDKTVLVWAEQGVGDEIMFANALPDIIAAAGHCVVECDPRLVTLFARSFPSAEVIGRSDPPHPRCLMSDIDRQIPMGSLPRWFRASVESFPEHHGYLVPDPQRVEYWQHRLEAIDGRPKIGICWRSRHRNAQRNLAYTELEEWGAIFSVTGVSFVNLQYDECRTELEDARLRFGVGIHVWDDIDLMNDLDEVAALTMALDGVIAPSTSVSAMAGALGKPVLQFTFGEGWPALGSGRYPWYPALKMFVRQWGESWERVLAAVARDIEGLVSGVGTDLGAEFKGLRKPDLKQRDVAGTMAVAVQHHLAGRVPQAEALYRQVLKAEPEHADALHLLGRLILDRGDPEAADELISRATRNKPDPVYFFDLGRAKQDLKLSDEAIACYRQALSLKPDFAEAQVNLGNEFKDRRQLAEAIECYQKAIAIKPDFVEAHGNLGDTYKIQGDFDRAMDCYQRALSLKPDYPEAHNGMGAVLADRHEIDAAISHYFRALEIRPDNVVTLSNLGNAHAARGDVARGIECFQRALSLEPDRAETHFCLAIFLLLTGDLARGWQEYDWRWNQEQTWSFNPPAKREFPQPWWNGEDPKGKTLLVWAEQGVGDAVMFANALPGIIAAAGHCVVECDPRQVSLFARSFPDAEIVPRLTPPDPRTLEPNIDLQIPMGSLSRWFRASVERFPEHQGYLVPDPERVAHWRRRLDALDDRPKIGICWRSIYRSVQRDAAYTELAQWGTILSVPGVSFVNLQYDDCRAELDEARQRFGVEIHAWDDIDLLHDLDEAAALTAAMDAVISVATSVAATAGALGIPVLMLTPNGNWTSLGTEGLPWYPKTRLFVRNWDEAWEGALAAVARSLDSFVSGKAAEAVEVAPRATAADAGGTEFAEVITRAIHAASEYQQQGRFAEAEALYSQILAVQPNNAMVLNLLGVMAHQMGDNQLGVELLTRAIDIDPAAPSFHNNLGGVYDAMGRLEDAAECYREAIRMQPGYADSHYNLGTVLFRLDRKEEAVASFNKAIDVDPGLFKAHNNLGGALTELSDYDGAIEHFQRAIEIEPDHSAALSNLGNAYMGRGDIARSLECHRRALSLEADRAETHWNLSFALLAAGDLRQGWQEYDWRWRGEHERWIHAPPPNRNFPQAWWVGEDPRNKTILVWAEQGVGDEILFANALPDLIATARHCVVECEPRLVSLFARSFPSAEVVARRTPPDPRTLEPDIDLQIPMGSLPRWFRTSPERFPKHHGYLVPDQERVAHWQGRLEALNDRPKVGICWRSKVRGAGRNLAYTELPEWGPIFSVPGITFVNLQYDDCRAELEDARQRFGVEIHTWDDIDLMNDLDEVAALTAALDVVISPATSVASMGGAIGTPVLEMSPTPNWTALGTDRMPWYPDTKLFLRNWGESWEGALAAIAQDLSRFASGKPVEASPLTAIAGAAGIELDAAVNKAIQVASEYQQAGRFSEAEALYSQILAVQPNNAQVLNLLGVMAHQMGDSQLGVELIGRAIDIDPKVPSFRNNLGNVLKIQGKLEQAIACYKRALSLNVDFCDAHVNLGDALRMKGEFAEAVRHLKKALILQPDNAEAHNNLGSVLRDQEKFLEAAQSYRRALALNPGNGNFHNNLGAVLSKLDDADGAVAALERALELNPLLAEAHHNLGQALKEKSELGRAVVSAKRALELKPDFIDAYVALGAALMDQNKLDEAVACYERAHALDPQRVDLQSNWGVALHGQGRLAEAVQRFRQAIALAPAKASAHWNLAPVLLLTGDLAQGWQEYDWRWHRELTHQLARRDFPQPWWQGDDPSGKTLLIWAEQGVGDAALFANVLPDIIAAAKHCVVECDPRQVALFARSFPDAEIVPRLTPPDPRTLEADIDLQIPMGSLPRWFRSNLESFPEHQGYLAPDPRRVDHWKHRLAALNDQAKIGICWRSMLRNTERNQAYTELSQWGAIFAVPGVSFVNLQYDDCRSELEAVRNGLGIQIHEMEGVDLMNDLDDAAALTAALDLVISPATSVAATAGALGVPVWEFSPQANWVTLGTGKNPWCPSMRFFFREWNESWERVIEEIADALIKFRDSRSPM